jgi:hypothetical protein
MGLGYTFDRGRKWRRFTSGFTPGHSHIDKAVGFLLFENLLGRAVPFQSSAQRPCIGNTFARPEASPGSTNPPAYIAVDDSWYQDLSWVSCLDVLSPQGRHSAIYTFPHVPEQSAQQCSQVQRIGCADRTQTCVSSIPG